MKLELRSNKVKVLRSNGVLPGVVYGKGIDSTSVEVPYKEFISALSEYGLNLTFSVSLNKKKHIVYVKEIHRDPYDMHTIQHFDLVKVSTDDVISSDVPLQFIGKEVHSKGQLVLTTDLTILSVEYNVGSGVSHIDVDLSELTYEENLHVKDLVMPEGITCLNDPEDVVARLSYAKAIVTDEPEDEDAEPVVVESIKQSNEEN